MKHWYLILSMWAIIAVGCDPCEDCGEPLLYDPLVSLIFINQDSADILNDSIDKKKLEISELNTIRNLLSYTIDSLQDSLSTLQDLIDAGEIEYEDEYVIIDNSYTQALAELEIRDAQRDTLDSINLDYSTALKLILSGKVQVDKAVLVENGTIIEYEDSAAIYPMPLLMGTNAQSTSYEFEIREKVINVYFDYDIIETINEARVYKRIATNIRVNSPTDSISVKCVDPDNCTSNETTVTVYF